MTAAAQCPTCGHHFELRDGYGELLPLAYCSSCQSYYPESLGECKWCGTKPERAPIGPQIWKGIGVAALVVVVGTGYLLRDDEPPDGTRRAMEAAKAHSTRRADTAAPMTTVAIGDTAISGTVIASEDSISRDSAARVPTMSEVAVVTPPTTSVQTVSEVAVVTPRPTSVQTARSHVSAKPPVKSPTVLAAPTASTPRAGPTASVPRAAPTPSMPRAAQASTTRASTAASKSRRPARWVSSISRDWVVVRADASKRSRLVASIGPNSRVQLGESRGDWRRIRAKGLSGWVEQRAPFRVVASR